MSQADEIISRAKERHQAAVTEHALIPLETPWTGKVYLLPMARIVWRDVEVLNRAGAPGASIEDLTDLIMMRLRDENGRLVFPPKYKRELMAQVPAADMLDLIELMNTLDPEGIPDAKK